MTAPDLSNAEAEIVARFDAAPTLPEAYTPLSAVLDRLDELRAEPERTCQWCMARPGEWCENDCANPERRCHPTYAAQFAADRGAYSDADAALIVGAVNAVGPLTAAVRAIAELGDQLDTEARRHADAEPASSGDLRAMIAAASVSQSVAVRIRAALSPVTS